MPISKPVKVIIGLFTAWIVLSPILFLGACVLFAVILIATPGQPQPQSDAFGWLIFPFILLAICTSFLHLGLQAFYLVHIILNKAGADAIRVIFAFGMLFLPYLAMPIYFLIYVVPDHTPAWALAKNPEQKMSTRPPGIPLSSTHP
jgi:hypothetical protein